MTRHYILVLIFLAVVSNTVAQQTETGDLFTKIETIISTMPGSSGNEYADPDASQKAIWDEVLNHIFNEDYALANSKANSIGYALIEFTDNSTNKVYYILANTSTNYWGTYVYNPEYLIPLVVQSPHPRYDTNTGLEGIYVFEEIDALFYCVSGTHRCNSSTSSTCSGTTASCGTSGPYKISDMAHNVTTVFQTITGNLATQYPDAYFISLHGFAKRDSDPYVILSNGTREYPSVDIIRRLKDKLEAEDNVLTFQIAHINTSWTRLIGFTNTQGRLLNNSDNECNSNATITSGRFIHMEQEKSRLRNDINGWRKVANALKNTFSDPVTKVNYEDEFSNGLNIYPNPTNGKITISKSIRTLTDFRIYSSSNQDLTSFTYIEESDNITQINLTQLPKGIYLLKTNFITKKIVLQ